MADNMHDFTTEQVAAVLPEAPSDELVAELTGLADGLEVEVVTGDEGVAHLDVRGDEHGLVAKVKRTVQEEQAPIGQLVDALAAGRSVVFVHTVDEESTDEAIDLLKANDASFMYHFGELTNRRIG